MESRYALREIQCAIGYDCRRLKDGRDAHFRHTFAHKRAKRDFLENRDSVMVFRSSLISASNIISRHGVKFETANDIVSDCKKTLCSATFPYMKFGDSSIRENDLDMYFDELDEMIEEDNRLSGQNESKELRNDIIKQEK